VTDKQSKVTDKRKVIVVKVGSQGIRK